MKRVLLYAALATFLLSAPAGAVVYVEGTGEPAFTNTSTNTQWVRWQGSPSYDQYRLEFDMYAASQLVKTELTANVAPNGSGVTWINWAGVSALQEGATYTICGYGRYWIGGIPSRDTGSCFDADQTNRRASTTIDRTAPSIAVKIDGGAPYSRTAKLNYNIDYSDNLAFPFPANFICRDVGADPATACVSAVHAYNEACSVPLGGMKKVTYFNCDEDLAAANVADGPVTFCAISADSAIPDNPNGPDQGASADKANKSSRVCDSIVIDRTAPQATVTADRTTVLTGDLVTFGVQASDATSGLAADLAWKWGDNTADGMGAAPTHSFTTAGTYEVKATVKDAAGNATTAAKVITVNPRPTGTDNGGGGGTTPTPTPTQSTGGGSGTVTPAPTVKEIVKEAGGGGAQETTVAGLEVVAPKRLKLTAKTRALSIALTAEAPGSAAIALVRAGKVHAKGTAAIAAVGTLGYRLRLPKKLKAGAYQLKISFTPRGASTATTKTVRLAVTAAKRARRATLARAAGASGHRAGALRLEDAPFGLPTGKAPKAPRSRRVDLG
jgi:plastocyanin